MFVATIGRGGGGGERTVLCKSAWSLGIALSFYIYTVTHRKQFPGSFHDLKRSTIYVKKHKHFSLKTDLITYVPISKGALYYRAALLALCGSFAVRMRVLVIEFVDGFRYVPINKYRRTSSQSHVQKESTFRSISTFRVEKCASWVYYSLVPIVTRWGCAWCRVFCQIFWHPTALATWCNKLSFPITSPLSWTTNLIFIKYQYNQRLMWSGVMACYGGSQRFSRESNHTQHETKWDDVTGHDFGTPSTVRAIRINVMACKKISSYVLNCTYMYICVCVDFLRDSGTFSFYHVGMLQNCRVLYSLYSLCQGEFINKTNATLNDRLSSRRSFFKTLRTLLAACIDGC